MLPKLPRASFHRAKSVREVSREIREGAGAVQDPGAFVRAGRLDVAELTREEVETGDVSGPLCEALAENLGGNVHPDQLTAGAQKGLSVGTLERGAREDGGWPRLGALADEVGEAGEPGGAVSVGEALASRHLLLRGLGVVGVGILEGPTEAGGHLTAE